MIRAVQELKANPARRASEIARSCSVSRATFYRRLDQAAKLLGFRARYDRRSGTFRIVEGHFGPVFSLSPLEVFSLIMAARHLSVAGDHTVVFDAITAVRRIAATGPKSLRYFFDYLLSDLVLEKSYCCSPEVLEPLHRAVERRGQVRIEYHDISAGVTPKVFTVDPYHILFKWRALYLDGYCHETSDFRMFRVSRIRKVEVTPLKGVKQKEGYCFARRHGNSFRVFVSENDPVEVRVRFSPRVAPMIMESFWHPSERKEPLPTGGCVLSVRVSHPPEVVWWALQWGADAEVLSPPEMREYAARTIKEMAKIYERDR